MKKRNYYTIGFSILFGTILGSLRIQLANIRNMVNSMSSKHNILETIDILAGEKLIENNEEDVKSTLERIKKIQQNVDYFNEAVKKFNKIVLEDIDFFPNLPNLQFIDQKNLLLNLNQRFLKKYKNKESQGLANEVLNLKIISLLNQVTNSISDIEKFFLNLMDDINIDISEKYKRGFREARAILSIGCSETAVFVIGRTIETLIDDLLINEIKKSNIQKIDLKKIKLGNKIGKLKGISIIEDKEFHMLSKLKFDRNDFGHPFDREISFDEAKRIILDAFDLIKILEKKLY